MSELNIESNPNGNAANIQAPERSKLKFDLWERKLLDLSTRNSLLNLRIKGSAVPLFVPGCSNIEDLIAQEKSFRIISRGAEEEQEEGSENTEVKGVPAKDYSIEDLADITDFKEYIDKKYEKSVLGSSGTAGLPFPANSTLGLLEYTS